MCLESETGQISQQLICGVLLDTIISSFNKSLIRESPTGLNDSVRVVGNYEGLLGRRPLPLQYNHGHTSVPAVVGY